MTMSRFYRSVLGLVAALSLVVLPGATVGLAAPNVCSTIQIAVDYTDPTTNTLVTINGDASSHFPVPVGVPLTFKLFPAAEYSGLPITFNSPNQYLVLNTGSLSDNGASSFNTPQTIPNVNFIVKWPVGDTSNDGQVSFVATVDPSNVPPGKTSGALLTVGAHIQGGRCGAHLEIFGVGAGGPGPGPGPCPGISVFVEFEKANGTYAPVMAATQSPTNTQYSGPGVGKHVRYTITSSNGQPFTPALQLIGSFNRQTIESASGAANTIVNSSTPRKVFFNKTSATWSGQTLIITTVATTIGLDTVRFDSLNRNGTINSRCSTHRELRIAATPGD